MTTARAVPEHAGEAHLVGLLDGSRTAVDDHDLVVRGAAVEQGARRGASLDAEPDDHGVREQGLPPPVLTELPSRPLGQHLQRGTDQSDQEDDPQGRDDQDVEQAGEVALRGDVAVARRGQADRRVVDRVEEADAVAVDVAVAVAVEPHQEPDGHRDQHGDPDPRGDLAQRTRGLLGQPDLATAEDGALLVRRAARGHEASVGSRPGPLR
jgi:hypothetical protein